MASNSIYAPLIDLAHRKPDWESVVVITDDARREVITAEALRERSTRISAGLAAAGVVPGDLVVLDLGHSSELIACLFGLWHRGAIATVYPFLLKTPDPETGRSRLIEFARQAGARAIVVPDTEPSTTVEPLLLSVQRLLEHSTADPEPFDVGDGDFPSIVQFTSGTSGLRKGVTLTHKGVSLYSASMIEALEGNETQVMVNWMPLYHDFGLIAALIVPISAGARTVLVSPLRWARSPGSFFRLIHEYRAAVTGMTNAGLHHAIRYVRPRELEGLDLSCVRHLICGAERIRHDSVELFLNKFASVGFSRAALNIGYGMAENVLGVSLTPSGGPVRTDWVSSRDLLERKLATPVDSGSPGATSVLSCGNPFRGTQVKIVDEIGSELPERCVGQVMITSPYLFSEYRGQPALTADAKKDGWYATGDSGYLADGELYVCGRLKDVIIVDGRNLQPDDLEGCAIGIEGLRTGYTVAFGNSDDRTGTERLVMLSELSRSITEEQGYKIEAELRSRVMERLEVRVHEVHLVPKGWMIWTSNGKLTRGANREKYLAERQPRQSGPGPNGEVEAVAGAQE